MGSEGGTEGLLIYKKFYSLKNYSCFFLRNSLVKKLKKTIPLVLFKDLGPFYRSVN